MKIRISTRATLGRHYPYVAKTNAISFRDGALHPVAVDQCWLDDNAAGAWSMAFDVADGGIIAFEDKADATMWRVRG